MNKLIWNHTKPINEKKNHEGSKDRRRRRKRRRKRRKLCLRRWQEDEWRDPRTRINTPKSNLYRFARRVNYIFPPEEIKVWHACHIKQIVPYISSGDLFFFPLSPYLYSTRSFIILIVDIFFKYRGERGGTNDERGNGVPLPVVQTPFRFICNVISAIRVRKIIFYARKMKIDEEWWMKRLRPSIFSLNKDTKARNP